MYWGIRNGVFAPNSKIAHWQNIPNLAVKSLFAQLENKTFYLFTRNFCIKRKILIPKYCIFRFCYSNNNDNNRSHCFVCLRTHNCFPPTILITLFTTVMFSISIRGSLITIIKHLVFWQKKYSTITRPYYILPLAFSTNSTI